MMSGLEFKPVFASAWTGVFTQCEDCGKTISDDEWFYRDVDDDGVLKRLCSQCFKGKIPGAHEEVGE